MLSYLAKMSTTTSVNGDSVKSLEPMGEAAVEGNVVPTLALDQVTEEAGKNVAVANNVIEKPLPNKNTQIPPLVPKKSKSTTNIDPKVYVEDLAHLKTSKTVNLDCQQDVVCS